MDASEGDKDEINIEVRNHPAQFDDPIISHKVYCQDQPTSTQLGPEHDRTATGTFPGST